MAACSDACDTADSIDIASGSLTGPSELKGSIGNSLTIIDGTESGAADRLAFRATVRGSRQNITTGTIYYSFLLSVDSLTGANSTSGDYFISLNNTANNTRQSTPTVHPGRNAGPHRSERRDEIQPGHVHATRRHLLHRQRGRAWVNGLTPGQTVFVVGSFNVGASNSAQIWVNPDPLTFGLVRRRRPRPKTSCRDRTGRRSAACSCTSETLSGPGDGRDCASLPRGPRSPRSELPRCIGTSTAPRRAPAAQRPAAPGMARLRTGTTAPLVTATR